MTATSTPGRFAAALAVAATLSTASPPAPGKSRYDAWSPTLKIDFHRPWRFGVLRFE